VHIAKRLPQRKAPRSDSVKWSLVYVFLCLRAFARVFSPVGAKLWPTAKSQQPTANSQQPKIKFAQSQIKYYLYALIESFIEKNFF